MLPELLTEAAWLLAPFVLIGVLAWGRRVRWAWLLILVVSALVIGIYRELFSFADVRHLATWLDVSDISMLALAWIFFGQAMRAAGGIRPLHSPLVTAGLCGALMGDLASAFFLPTLAKDKTSAGRLVLAAAGGSLIGRSGNLGILLMSEHSPESAYFLIPLAVVMMLIARPAKDAMPMQSNVSWVPTIAALGVAVSVFFFPQHALLAFVCATFGLLPFAKKEIIALPTWQAIGWGSGVIFITVLAVTGAPELLAWGLELNRVNHGSIIPLALGAGGVLLATVIDPIALAVFSHAFADRAMDLRLDGAMLSLTAGIACGGVFHLYLAKSFRPVVWRWLLQVVVALLYIGGICWFTAGVI